VKVWDTLTGREVRTLTGHGDAVFAVAFHPDEGSLASGSRDGVVKVWDTRTGRETRTLRGHSAQVCGVAFSPDGTRLASADREGTVRVWDAAADRPRLTLPGSRADHPVQRVAFSPDGLRLASSLDGRVWDLTSGRPIFTVREHGPACRSVVFSPDGTRLASAGWNQTVRVGDSTSGQELLTLPGHRSNIVCLAFSPEGTRLASAGDDRTVRIWDVGAGQEVLTLTVAPHSPFSVAFSADGTRLAAATDDGVVKVWDARPLTPDAPAEREALGLLDYLFARPLLQVDVRDYLRRSSAIRPAVREKALALLERYAEETDPERYHRAAWAVLRQPYLNDCQYGFALRQARTACALAPGQVRYQTTLAVALYHAGQGEQARATLARLRKLLGDPRRSGDRAAHDFLREAEALLGPGKP
jgi:WD40 repeat protein